ncbi:hypothetical protein MPSEU_000251300 [Mayamaea pseudoterrestris]|nr:hypothetical protein MPSEU_000251300 [Mayamaea pseudoterrestris]
MATEAEAKTNEALEKEIAKLEAETGKKFKVKEKLPSVNELILQNAMKQKTFAEAAKFPVIVFTLFIVLLHLFLKYMPPSQKKFMLPQVRQQQQRQAAAAQQVTNQAMHAENKYVAEPIDGEEQQVPQEL